MCCGQSRAAYAAGDGVQTLPEVPVPAAPSGAQRAPAAAPAQAAAGGVRLRFTEQARVRVRGPATGDDYVFSGSDPVRTVDAGDAEALLRTGYFRRAI
ncbi:MAG TPA: hypothetical protein VFH27_11790 [Longimicrobiaceae bacterium]|nr:hypothetical protein [Longimicrobiaceae bacterium]